MLPYLNKEINGRYQGADGNYARKHHQPVRIFLQITFNFFDAGIFQFFPHTFFGIPATPFKDNAFQWDRKWFNTDDVLVNQQMMKEYIDFLNNYLGEKLPNSD